MTDDAYDSELRRVADEFVMTAYVVAEHDELPVGVVLHRAVLDARARLVEQGALTEKEGEGV